MDRAIHPAAPPGLPIGKSWPWLAPLAGYTDLPFRLLCREQGASAACTEMVSAKGLVLGQGRKSNATNDLLATHPPLKPPVRGSKAAQPCGVDDVAADSPLVVQLFGAEAETMGEAVRMLADAGYAWFDCNMGCSVPKVGKSGAGSAMLDDPDNAVRVASAMVQAAGPGRVGCKLRLGREQGREVYVNLGQRLADVGIGWLTLHPRYSRQKFTGQADWSAVRALVRAVEVPVMLSGDLFTATDAVRALAESDAAGVMFARGAMQNPAIFGQFIQAVEGGQPSPLTKGDLERLIRRHADLVKRFYPVRLNRQGIEAGLLKMRTFVPRYVKECAGARALRRELVQCSSWDALDRLLDDFFGQEENLIPRPQGDG